MIGIAVLAKIGGAERELRHRVRPTLRSAALEDRQSRLLMLRCRVRPSFVARAEICRVAMASSGPLVAISPARVQIARMAIEYEFVGAVLVGRAIGTYPLSELDTALAAAVSDPTRPPLRGALLDVRASESVGRRTVPEIRDTALLIAAMSRSFGRRVALLAGSDLQYGVMRMIAAWAEGSGIDVAVFRDEREAFAWASRETPVVADADPHGR